MLDIVFPAIPLVTYLVVGAVAALDLFVPILPTGALMIANGALAAQGELVPAFLILSGTLGAWMGDIGGYRLGRRFAHIKFRRVKPKSPAWHQYFARYTLLSLIAARYLPAGRTVAAFTAGRQGFPRRKYARAALVAEVLWQGDFIVARLGRM